METQGNLFNEGSFPPLSGLAVKMKEEAGSLINTSSSFKNLFVGIDVGKNGAIVIMDDNKNIIFKESTPVLGKEYDLLKVSQILEAFKERIVHAVVEDVHSIFGIAAEAQFQFGMGKGIWLMALTSLRIPYTPVAPKKWQTIWEGTKKVTFPTKRINKKTGNPVEKVDTKATSLLCVKRLFPDADLRENSRCRTFHDGIVDATLMAEYCRRNFR